jgi:hypothetical protein
MYGYNVDLLDLTRGSEELCTSRGSLVVCGEAFVAKLKEVVQVV